MSCGKSYQRLSLVSHIVWNYSDVWGCAINSELTKLTPMKIQQTWPSPPHELWLCSQGTMNRLLIQRMHCSKLKYNQQKWIWILMPGICILISISCPQPSCTYWSMLSPLPQNEPLGIHCWGQSNLNHKTHPASGENAEPGWSPPTPSALHCLQ